jgi:peptidoglycan LD-endopeptidase LytH
MKVFPVAASGKPNFGDTFGAPRGNLTHEGIDVFAREGTPVLAVDDGALTFGEGKIGGHFAHLLASDGTRYYFAHLQRYEGAPRTVRAGDVIAYVGHTGNAANTPPHLHLEVRPAGSGPINPFSELVALAPAGAVTKAGSPSSKPGAKQWGGLGALLLLLALSRNTK